jgi:hypothetical protein
MAFSLTGPEAFNVSLKYDRRKHISHHIHWHPNITPGLIIFYLRLRIGFDSVIRRRRDAARGLSFQEVRYSILLHLSTELSNGDSGQ